MFSNRYCRRLVVFLAGLMPLPVSAQPSPPPPPGWLDYISLLDQTYNGRRLVEFGSLFSDDVKVFVEGKQTASSRAEFLIKIKNEFEQNLKIRSFSRAQGSQILVMQEVNGCIPVEPNPHTVYHGCPRARAVRYDIGDRDKIVAVHILDAENAWNMHPAGH